MGSTIGKAGSPDLVDRMSSSTREGKNEEPARTFAGSMDWKDNCMMVVVGSRKRHSGGKE
jgi:hypothetical protein